MLKSSLPPPLELWGGIEGTVNRVGDVFFSQLVRNGHDLREGDIERCASLGIKALRYPLLWERVAPLDPDAPSWVRSDEQMSLLRRNGLTPIAGLLHHGSGPSYTSLVDPEFPEKFARYAQMVARRYPWIDRYTPVNEPLTTARFSGLYGFWYPHGRDERVFGKALLNQCRATVLAMREIRRVNDQAQLIQTEDLGKTYSTPSLAYQAGFNNELRWLAWDLLSGRVSRSHALWQWLTDVCGVSEHDLAWFADNPCAPDLVGVNHYITSERFIDERIERYPVRYHGGNGRHRYADIESARSLAAPAGGLQPLLQEAWERYRLPLAITEIHIDSTRDDHLRWIRETWDEANAARAAGVDIRGYTIWALFGSFDWNCLLTASHGYYEPGAFDVRGGVPRETAVAGIMRELSAGATPSHAVLATPGWWHRDDRFFCDPVPLEHAGAARRASCSAKDVRPILISGANGTLGRAFARICARRGLAYRLLDRSAMDIADQASVADAIAQHAPWAVINASGYVRIDEAERDVDRCHRENVVGPQVLAAECARTGIPLVVFSSDMVFDGRRDSPYTETQATGPLNVYGQTKAIAEERVLARHRDVLVVRTSSFFGPWDQHNYVAQVLMALTQGRPFHAASDLTVSPTYVPHLVHVTLDLLIDGEKGVWHLTNEHPLTWSDFARCAADRARMEPALLRACPHRELQWVARRPAYSALKSERTTLMPTFERALDEYFRETAALSA
jgi:dTDP-4-dehydrorhamnose reductase